MRGEHPQLWGVAIEALVQSGNGNQIAALGKDIGSPTRSGDWKDNIVLGLLRSGQQQFREPILAHIRQSIDTPRKLTIPIVAALCRIDRETCLELAAAFLDDANRMGRSVDGYIPAFVRNFVAVDDALLGELVARLFARRVEAGEWTATSFDTYLTKPWMLEELGSERIEQLRRSLWRGRNTN